ncbi:MAG: hypothetical protein L6461_11760, partial [Anaerolineae bacterium]|nr:hypothetical protein [Anaerolineae bacterium]
GNYAKGGNDKGRITKDPFYLIFAPAIEDNSFSAKLHRHASGTGAAHKKNQRLLQSDPRPNEWDESIHPGRFCQSRNQEIRSRSFQNRQPPATLFG